MLCPFMRTTTFGLQFPCNTCEACIVNNRRKVSGRLILESRLWEDSTFVTLTYDENQAPRCEHGLTLDPLHARNFIRRLRAAMPAFRYFVCGEYGSMTKRPHYHGMLYGLRYQDLYCSRTNTGPLVDLWGHGFVQVYPGDDGLAMYTSSYVSKKVARRKIGDRLNPRSGNDIPSLDEPFDARAPEFTRSSRNPGLGAETIKACGDTWVRNGHYARHGYMPYVFRQNGKKWPFDDYARSLMAKHTGLDKGTRIREHADTEMLDDAYVTLLHHEQKTDKANRYRRAL